MKARAQHRPDVFDFILAEMLLPMPAAAVKFLSKNPSAAIPEELTGFDWQCLLLVITPRLAIQKVARRRAAEAFASNFIRWPEYTLWFMNYSLRKWRSICAHPLRRTLIRGFRGRIFPDLDGPSFDLEDASGKDIADAVREATGCNMDQAAIRFELRRLSLRAAKLRKKK